MNAADAAGNDVSVGRGAGIVRAHAGLLLAAALMAGALCALASPARAGAQPADVAGAPMAFGDAPSLGGAPSVVAAREIGMAATPDGQGYWIVGSDGGIYSFGDAGFFGSMGGQPLNRPIVGMAATPDGAGYWLVASDGGMFSFGDAHFYGSTGAMTLNKPVVGMAATPDGAGYWLVASDGGIFSFGDASFYGSMGGTPLAQPVVGIAATSDGQGYMEVAADGGIFTFGDAHFYGSAAGASSAMVVGVAMTSGGGGYWLASADGGIFSYGDAQFFGSAGGGPLANPVVAIAATHDDAGYWLLASSPPPPPPPVVLPVLALGSSGNAVLSVQQQLTNLGYWLGTPSGQFDDATQQAVWALQKAAGIPRTGVVDAATYAALAQAVRPSPLGASGYVIEVDLQDDLVMFVNNGNLLYTLNTSTGGGYYYDGGTLAATPAGHFSICRTVNGLVVDSLGALWRPRYFTGGFAIHGDSSVPPVPVSHGCVRVSNEAIDWIWAANLAPIGTAVWVY